MNENDTEFKEVKFRKDIKKLKIPENCKSLPAEDEDCIEFVLEIEWQMEIFIVRYHII